MNKTTLKEYGQQLPMGIVETQTGKLHRSFEIRPWRLAEEKELGRLQQSKSLETPGAYVTSVLSYMLTKLGPYNFTDMSPDERDLVINQMFMGDVWAAYVWVRIKALGPELVMKYDCPHCRQRELTFNADLYTTDMVVVDSIPAAAWEYKLIEPIEIRSKRADVLAMGPLQWSCMQSQGATGVGDAKAAAIVGSVRGLPGLGPDKQIVLTEDDLLQLTKRDIEGMVKEINERVHGPIMLIEDKCVNEKCRKPINLPIDWKYGSFFGTSSV